VVAAALIQGRLSAGLLASVSVDAVTDVTLRAVVELARGAIGSGDGDLPVVLRDRAVAEGRDDVAGALAKLATYEFVGDDPDQEIHDCVVALRIEQRQRLIDDLPRAIARCEAQGKAEETNRLKTELDRLTKEKSELRQLRGTHFGASPSVRG
jgi:hypothetical protein